MAASTSARDLQATVEDYDSDQSEMPVVDSFRRSSPGANVAAKRSHHSDLGADKPPADQERVVPIDLRSDSGYSSHTAGTFSSADSVPSAKLSQISTAPSSAASVPPPSAAVSKRRQTMVEGRRKDSEGSRKPLQRNNSVSTSKRPAGSRRPTQTEECTDPLCRTCGPNAASSRRGRRQSVALDSRLEKLDISYPSSDVRSQRSDPASTYTSPPSPVYNRQPASYMQGSAVVQPAQTRPRASSTARRPMSYHGDPRSGYNPMPGMPGGYPSPPQEYGPPLSASAHYPMQHQQHHPQMASYNMMGATPPNQYYQGGHPLAQHMSRTSPPYEQQQPPLSARPAQARRPVSGYGTLVTYDNKPEPAMPSARYGNLPQSATQPGFPPRKAIMPTAQDSESSEEYESGSEDDMPPPAPVPPPKQIIKQIMAPPKPPKRQSKKETRPVLRHAKTTQVTQVYNDRRERRQSMSQPQALPERPSEVNNRPSSGTTARPSRTMSVSRPQPKRIAQSAYELQRGRVVVENPKTSRRQSYLAYQQVIEPESEEEYVSEKEEPPRRRRPQSRVYDSRDEDAIVLADYPPRRRTDSISSVNSIKRDYTERVQDVEAYLQRSRGNYEPLTEQVHKDAKRHAARVPSDPDRKTRISQSAQTTVTHGNNGEIRLRVDASAPLSLSFNGDMEGRTLQINPAEDGMADIVIGGQRGEDNVYHSERGSVRGSRNSMIAGSARRDAEDASIKSGRSSHGRRESREVFVENRRDRDRVREGEPRRLLRRATQTQYYDDY